MKRYIYRMFAILPAMLLALAGTSCADDLEPDPVAGAEPNSITLKLSVPMEPSTRATTEELNLNEFKVRNVHFYFYKSGDASGLSAFDCIMPADFDSEGTVTVTMPSDALLDGGIFGTTGTDCIVYAVANADETFFPEETPKTIEELKATSIVSAFDDQSKKQDSFVMDGQAVVELTDRVARTAQGEITLTRAAAKLTLTLALPETIEAPIVNPDGTTSTEKRQYTPSTADMRVWIGNGVKQSPLNTEPRDVAADEVYSNEITTAEGSGSPFTFDDNMVTYKYVQNMPFYSYPNKWVATNPDGNTHLTLVIPWKYTNADGTSGQITTYYRLAVQPQKCEIQRNMHYDMRVSIERLGGVEPEKPINITPDWDYAIPWNNQTLGVDIKEIRYLLLNNNYLDREGRYVFEMNNETDLNVTLGTSHDVEIASVTMIWRDYLNDANREQELTPDGIYTYSNIAGYTSTSGTNFAGIEVDNSTSTLKFKRDLKHIEWVSGYYRSYPRSTANDAFCSYTFDIVLRHKDDPNITATVRITQYPSIYITSQLTPINDVNGNPITTRFVNNNNTTREINGVSKGYVGRSGTDSGLHLGSIHEGNNKNTYIITISRFNANEDYVIADPRSRTVDNLIYINNDHTHDWSVEDDKGKTLKNYYPSDPSSEKTRYIAPKIRIASQMGITYEVYRDAAKRRCASYQENGRPAGRWRLPTIAEIEFIANLSSNQYIPYLFGSSGKNADYWCASGAVNVNNTADPPKVELETGEGGQRYARCVYDEWYWGTDTLTEADKTKFTWGDKKRTTSGN